MKHLLFLLSILFGTNVVFSQDTEVYYFKSATAVVEYDIIADQATTDIYVAQKNFRFNVDRATLTGYVITFIKWDESGEDNQEKNQRFYQEASQRTLKVTGTQVLEGQQKYFYISKQDFAEFTGVYVDNNPKYSFVTGALIVPIKIRPGSEPDKETGERVRPFDFTSDFNIGISAGLRMRLEKQGDHHLNIIGGISITSVAVEEQTTQDFLDAKTNAAAITINAGLIYEYKDFQAGFIMGWDRLSRELGDSWVYQGKPWFGLGIGYNIFNTKEASATQP